MAPRKLENGSSRGRLRWLILLLLAVFVAPNVGCNRFQAGSGSSASGGGTMGGGIGATSQLMIQVPLFEGISDLVPQSELVYVAWDAASDNVDAPEDLIYRIYVATEAGAQDFLQPTFQTAPGVTSVELGGLTDGVTLFVVVRAVDLDGNEDGNTVEWIATPNPVRYVDAASTAAPPDGLTPQTAYPAIGQAVGGSAALGGVNIWVASGVYSENAFLFDGMCLYGGFADDWLPGSRDLETVASTLVTSFSVPLVTIPESVSLTGIDGFVLAGNGVATAGVKVDDAFFRLTQLEIRDTVSQGVELRSDFLDDSLSRGLIASSTIRNSGGEGVFFSGIFDLVIDNNTIEECVTEGIESQWLYALAGERTEVRVTRNVIRRNGDEGIDLDVAEIDELDPTSSSGGRVRLVIQNNVVSENRLQGLQVDVDFEESDGIDLRVRIDDCVFRANGTGGLLLDGDARAYFRVARCVISANSGDGIFASGTSAAPWLNVTHCRLLGNQLAGIRVEDLCGGVVRNCVVRGNGGAGLLSTRAGVEIRNTLLLDNGAASVGDRVAYSLVDGEPMPVARSIVEAVHGDPLLENHPVSIEIVTPPPTGAAIPVADPPSWLIGDVAEVADDGVARSVVDVTSSAIVVDPPLAPTVGPSLTLHHYLAGESVEEREGLGVGSPAIDSGDPLEEDRDESRADLGPIGGNTPGNVGVETGLPRSTQVEVLSVEPAAGFLVTGPIWSVGFNVDVTAAMFGAVRVFRNGVEEAPTVEFDGTRVHVSLNSLSTFPPLFPAGDEFQIEFEPQAAGDLVLRDHVVFTATSALEVEDADLDGGSNSSVATAQPLTGEPAIVHGTIGVVGDTDVYRVPVVVGSSLRVELFAGRDESPLVGRVEILASDGTTLLASSTAQPPAHVDPVINALTIPAGGDIYVVVEDASGLGSPAYFYRLAIEVRAP